MKPYLRLIFTFALCLLTFALSAVSQTTLTGDHIIDGYLDVNGSTFTLDADTTTGGITFQFDDATVKEISLINNATSAASWIWGYDDGSSGTTVQMKLDETNKLVLYNPASPYEAIVTIDPDAATPKITIGGSDVLTKSNLSSDFTIRKGTGTNAIAINTYDWWTSGDHSLALGFQTKASSLGSVALGFQTNSSGLRALATGFGTIASGYASTAMGQYSEASGTRSTALGLDTIALGYGQLVLGEFNIASGNSTTRVDSDYVIVVGNGTNDTTRSNAMTINWLGDTWMAGGLQASNLEVGDTVSSSGTNSVAFGQNTSATSINAAAFGKETTASASQAFAAGSGTTITSTAISGAAFGSGNTVRGQQGFAAGGANNNVDGSFAFAANYSNDVMGDRGTAFGANHHVLANDSTVFGIHHSARSYNSFIIGRYSSHSWSHNPTTWVDTEPLFIIGNGADNTNRANAVVVKKNGETDISGDVQAPVFRTTQAAGDISMGAFTN